MSSAQKLLKRFATAEAKLGNFKSTYQEAFKYFSPNRDTFDKQGTEGDKRNTGGGVIFDSTGQDSLRKAVSNLQSSVFPPQKKFAALRLGQRLRQQDGAKVEEAQKVLDVISDIFFGALFASNFDTQISEVLEDLLIGTGSMLMQKGTQTNPFIFSAVPMSEIFLERGADGAIKSHFRKWDLEVGLIAETWADAKLTDELNHKVNSENPQEKVQIIECTVKAKIEIEAIEGDKRVKKRVDGYEYYVLYKTDILLERKMQSSPWITMRYGLSAGEVYGRGPVLDALPDCKTLNKTKELILKNGALAISGVWTVVDDGVVSMDNIKIQPGATIPVSSNPGNPNGPSLAPLPIGANFNIGQIIIEDLKKSIRSIMMVDPLGEIDAPVKSATEISYRAQQTSKLLGSAYGRMQIEGVKAIINRGLHILEELALIENVDQLRVDGVNLAIEHESPLARAQSEEEINAMVRYAETISGFYGPQMLAMMTNPIMFGKLLAEKMNVPKSILPTMEQLQQTLQAAQAEQTAGQPPAPPQPQLA